MFLIFYKSDELKRKEFAHNSTNILKTATTNQDQDQAADKHMSFTVLKALVKQERDDQLRIFRKVMRNKTTE